MRNSGTKKRTKDVIRAENRFHPGIQREEDCTIHPGNRAYVTVVSTRASALYNLRTDVAWGDNTLLFRRRHVIDNQTRYAHQSLSRMLLPELELRRACMHDTCMYIFTTL